MNHAQPPVIPRDLFLWIKRSFSHASQTECFAVMLETDDHRDQCPHPNRGTGPDIEFPENTTKRVQHQVQPINVRVVPGPFHVPIEPPLTTIRTHCCHEQCRHGSARPQPSQIKGRSSYNPNSSLSLTSASSIRSLSATRTPP